MDLDCQYETFGNTPRKIIPTSNQKASNIKIPLIRENTVYTQQIPTSSLIPQTPLPKRIKDVEVDAKDRFSGIIWINKDSKRNFKDYFIEYDNWEKYSELKSYSKRQYQAAYNGLMKEYQDYLCILSENNIQEYYVVSKRISSELEELEPFCTCNKCKAFIFNPMKYIWCHHCTKCIKSGKGFASEEYIEKAKKLKNISENMNFTKSKIQKYLDLVNHIKALEISSVIVFSLMIIWFKI